MGGLNTNNFSAILGSATTDLTVDLSASAGSGSNSGSPPGSLVTQDADFTIIGDVTKLTSGTAFSSTGGTITFDQGLTIEGAEINIANSTVAVGSSFSKSGGTLTMTGINMSLLSDLTVTSDSALNLNQLNLQNKTLTLQSVSPLSITEQVVIDNSNETQDQIKEL